MTFPLLQTVEARIVGCLIEKQATTPEQYPLTENAIQLACNQKTNREPIMEITLGDIGHALRRMEERGLVRSAHSARSLRYEHKAAQVYTLTPPQQAVLGLLLLRGPQTPNEIRQRTGRMTSFASLEDVQHVLDRLQGREAPLVARIPRAGAQREDRYTHLLCGPVDIEALRADAEADAPAPGGSVADRIAALEARVEWLEQLVREGRRE